MKYLNRRGTCFKYFMRPELMHPSEDWRPSVKGQRAQCLLGGVVPSRNPFLNRRGTCFKYFMRPEPVVRRRFAFTLQLNFRILADGYPQEEHCFFWMWYELLPQRGHSMCALRLCIPFAEVPFVMAASGRCLSQAQS